MKKNLLLLTFLSILPLTISAQNENCGLKTTENIESTAIPSEDFKFANDFTVAANSQLKLNTITFNVITDHQIDFTDMQFSLYEDKTGTLGNLLNTFKLKLTKYEELNNDIGIFTYKLTFEIPQEIIVKNETNEVKSYWISTESYQASSIFFSINT
ncbi:hypothetical protein, partial [Algoriella sp.]|uniref:hypothetical protein n=1 Tax=Algoriella sp. TaxID=1872434 RepID=UPI001B0E38DB